MSVSHRTLYLGTLSEAYSLSKGRMGSMGLGMEESLNDELEAGLETD